MLLKIGELAENFEMQYYCIWIWLFNKLHLALSFLLK